MLRHALRLALVAATLVPTAACGGDPYPRPNDASNDSAASVASLETELRATEA
jgi:hypothetical protein